MMTEKREKGLTEMLESWNDTPSSWDQAGKDRTNLSELFQVSCK